MSYQFKAESVTSTCNTKLIKGKMPAKELLRVGPTDTGEDLMNRLGDTNTFRLVSTHPDYV